jgi:putative transposase
MIYPLVRELADQNVPVAVTCRVLGFSKQAFYAWCKNPASQRDGDDAHLINAANDIHHDDPGFAYGFIADELRERGLAAGDNRVARLCSQQRIWSIFAKRPGLTRKAGPLVHDHLVDRQFTATAPNVLWLTDITEHRDRGGQALPMRDQEPPFRPDRRLLHGRVDHRISGRVRAAQRDRPGLTSRHHRAFSDRGSQFRSTAFVRTVKNNGLVGSMGRVGACGDNAATESFFALLQNNVLDRQRRRTREELRLAIITWVEAAYRRRRRQRRLGRLAPIEYETLTRADQAA